jgi:predicted  nucleic acid-binding Zn-ribbon protein
LSAADRLARREGYAKQVAGLQVENRRLRRELADDRKRHDDYRHACQHETDQLRTEIRGLEDQVTGFKRRLDAQASTLGRAVLGGFDAPSTEKRLSDDHVGDEK